MKPASLGVGGREGLGLAHWEEAGKQCSRGEEEGDMPQGWGAVNCKKCRKVKRERLPD